MNNDILLKVDNLISYIKSSNEYKEYMFLYEKLKNNKRANELINEVKTLQKELVKKESIGNDTTTLNQRLSEILDELNNIPLYVEFTQKQSILNELYQDIKKRLDDYFYSKLN